MFKNLLVASMLALSSCAFYTNVCDCESVTEERQEKLTKLLEPAIKDGKFELVEFLVSEGADIKSITNKNLGTEKEPKYPLFYSLYVGTKDFRLAELLIKNGADINKKFDDYSSPIETMCVLPNVAGIQFLLDNGIDVNYIENGESVLDKIAKYNMNRRTPAKEALQMLINAGAKLNKYKDDKEVKAFLGIE